MSVFEMGRESQWKVRALIQKKIEKIASNSTFLYIKTVDLTFAASEPYQLVLDISFYSSTV